MLARGQCAHTRERNGLRSAQHIMGTVLFLHDYLPQKDYTRVNFIEALVPRVIAKETWNLPMCFIAPLQPPVLGGAARWARTA